MAERLTKYRPIVPPKHVAADRLEANRFYASKDWRITRRTFLALHPLCEACQQRDGTLTPATEAHHVVERVDCLAHGIDPCDPKNLKPYCCSCHSLESARRRQANR